MYDSAFLMKWELLSANSRKFTSNSESDFCLVVKKSIFSKIMLGYNNFKTLVLWQHTHARGPIKINTVFYIFVVYVFFCQRSKLSPKLKIWANKNWNVSENLTSKDTNLFKIEMLRLVLFWVIAFSPNIDVLIKNLEFSSVMTNLRQKAKHSSKIDNLCQKSKMFVKNQNFRQKTK